MTTVVGLPRLLIIDDLFGRTQLNRRNEERANLCGQYLVEDITGDDVDKGTVPRVKRPIAQAFFCRGQTPKCSAVGDVVENDLEGTLRVIQEGWGDELPGPQRWALVLLDLCFYTGRVTRESDRRTPGMPEGRPTDDNPGHYFGLRLLNAIQERFPDLPIVILSSKPREQVSRTFAQRGALAFLPRGEERGPELLREYLWRHGLTPDDSGDIVGSSKALLLTLRAARRVALDRRNVLIRGERGTGKELLARYIHRLSSHATPHPLVVVDSGALSPQLYASELFGHRRGAFTGADRDRTGRIVQASGGDLFLDEIGNMPPDVQVGLLRVLEQRVVTPLGAVEGQPVDVRFLSATNDDLDGKAATGGFRQDLLDRFREGGTVFLRPLRERLEDLDLLVERLVREAERARPGALARRIEPEALDLLRSHDWPGNIRELRSCIYNAVSSYPDVEHLVPVHLHFGMIGREKGDAPRAVPPQAQPGLAPEAAGLASLLATLRAFSFEGVPPSELVGALPLVQEAYARLTAGLLRAALRSTCRATPDRPEGEVLIHPSIKLLMGDKAVNASRAADIIKRELRVCPAIAKELLADPLLREAYETALRLRPRQPPAAEPSRKRAGRKA